MYQTHLYIQYDRDYAGSIHRLELNFSACGPSLNSAGAAAEHAAASGVLRIRSERRLMEQLDYALRHGRRAERSHLPISAGSLLPRRPQSPLCALQRHGRANTLDLLENRKDIFRRHAEIVPETRDSDHLKLIKRALHCSRPRGLMSQQFSG